MTIDLTINAHVAVISLNRPDKLNALSLKMYDALGAAFFAVNADDNVRSVVLTGVGDRAFCVGADLKESIPALASGRMDISDWDPAHLKFQGFFKPVISAIRGLCIGGGFELMLGTDIRVVAEDSIFQLPEPGHGFVPAGGTLVRLVRQIGYAHAMEIMLTGRRFSAAEMVAKGVVNQTVKSDDVHATALEIAHRIASFSPSAIQTIKEAALTLQDLSLHDAFVQEAILGRRTFTSEDAKRGLAAFAARDKKS